MQAREGMSASMLQKKVCEERSAPTPPCLDSRFPGCVKTTFKRGNNPLNRHSRERGNPGVVERGNAAVEPRHHPWIPAFAGMTDWCLVARKQSSDTACFAGMTIHKILLRRLTLTYSDVPQQSPPSFQTHPACLPASPCFQLLQHRGQDKEGGEVHRPAGEGVVCGAGPVSGVPGGVPGDQAAAAANAVLVLARRWPIVSG